MRIRPATSDDVELIVEYNLRMALETEGKQLSRVLLTAGVRAVLTDSNRGCYFLAVEAEQVIGQLMITTEWSDWRNGQIWWIQSVFVEPKHRRRGVFRSLYRHVEGAARATPGVVGLRLYVEHNNVLAHQVYESLGMRHAGYLVFETMWSG